MPVAGGALDREVSQLLKLFKEECTMLVLSRKWNQEIVIAGNIRVKILEITGNRVRLGVEAPPRVSVLREEVATRNGSQSIADAFRK